MKQSKTTPHLFGIIAMFLKGESGSQSFYDAYLTTIRKLPMLTPRRYAEIVGEIGDSLFPSAARAHAFFHNVKYAVYAQFSLGNGQWSERLAQGFNMSYADARAYCEDEGLIMMPMDEWNRLEENKGDADIDMDQLTEFINAIN